MDTIRDVADYRNADGLPPDGVDNGTDETSAVTAALRDGPGCVRIGPGCYRFGDVTVPAGVTFMGSGRATVITSNGAGRILSQENVNEWRVRDMLFDGEASGPWAEREDLGQCGICVKGSVEWEISGVVIRNVSGAGIQLESVYSASPFRSNGTLLNIQATGCYAGIRFDRRAEYINAGTLGCWENEFGCVIHGGNTKITNSNFNSNLTGLFIEDKDNGSHGSISNCLVNHNLQHSLHCRNAANGMLIDGCCFFGGTMDIQDCAGINLTSSIICCPVTVGGVHACRVSGNYVIPRDLAFTFSESTLVQTNFTADGPWEMNR